MRQALGGGEQGRGRQARCTCSGGKEARALEPALVADRALLSPSTGIVDSHAFMLALRPPGIRSGQRKRRGRSNSSSTGQTVSVLSIRPSPLTRGQPPSPSGSFSPRRREKS
jgi:hypothetical protein